jgi:cell division protein FtsB
MIWRYGGDKESPHMWTRQHKKRNTGRLIVPGISALFLAYFGFHVYHGEYGINSRARYETRMAELRQQLDTVRARRVELEGRVSLRRTGTPCAQRLARGRGDDHAAWAILGLTGFRLMLKRPFYSNI